MEDCLLELWVFIQEYITRDKTAEEILTEDSLIPEDYNVMALKHLRYLPGCFHSHDFLRFTVYWRDHAPIRLLTKPRRSRQLVSISFTNPLFGQNYGIVV